MRWVYGIAAGLIVTVGGGLILNAVTSGPSTAPSPPPSRTPTPTPSTSSPTSTPPPASPTPVYISPIPMLIPGGGGMGIDFDSNPVGPDTSPNTLFLYLGNYLQTNGNIKIATWTKNVTPTRDQCNVLAQTQGNYEQPAERGGRYCV